MSSHRNGLSFNADPSPTGVLGSINPDEVILALITSSCVCGAALAFAGKSQGQYINSFRSLFPGATNQIDVRVATTMVSVDSGQRPG